MAPNEFSLAVQVRMKRSVIVCLMAALAAAGVAQVPAHWTYSPTPQAVAPNVNTLANRDVVGLPSAASENATVKAPIIIAKIATPTLAPAPPSSPAPVATVSVDEPTPAAAPTSQPRFAQGSALPLPPRNSDIPPSRAGGGVAAPVLPPAAVPRAQIPVEVKTNAPVAISESRRQTSQKTVRIATPPAPPLDRVTPASQAKAVKARPALAQAPTRQRATLQRSAPPALFAIRPKPVATRVAAWPPLAYAYAPAPRYTPSPRRAPPPRFQ